MTDNTAPQFVTPDRPADWVPVPTLRVGEQVVTRLATPAERAAGAHGGKLGTITDVYATGPASNRRWWIFIDGRLEYPKGRSSRAHELVVR